MKLCTSGGATIAISIALGAAACTDAPEAATARPVPVRHSVIAPAASSTAANPDSDASVAWLAGRWCGGEKGETIEETWTVPTTGEAIGMSVTTRGGRIAAFEFMRILDQNGTVSFIAQPSGNRPTSFVRTDGDKGWIRFENPKHDFPQRIEYRRVGDELHAQITGPGGSGEDVKIPYEYKRCAP